ncbi:hypothetical protein SRABI106_01927 [Rahnella aquatilis]|nr:hypothetical protein SRABI106_01927 [Rahnella aquatilis]
MAFNGFNHHFDQIRLLKLQRGKIHRYRPLRMTGQMPFPQLATGFIEHPFANRDNQSGFFRQRQKHIRAEEVTVALPAQQRFEATHRPVRRNKFRLIVQTQLMVCNRQTQIIEHLQLVLGIGIHRRLEETVTVTAGIFGVIHRGICIEHQLAFILAIARIHCDPHAGRDQQFVAGNVKRTRNQMHQFIGQLRGIGGFGDLNQQYKLIAAEPRQRICRPQLRLQAFGD